jgi:hypothetical protein
MDQGIGKTSTIISSALTRKNKTGIVTCEDPVAMLGAKLLGALAGVNSLDIIRKRLTKSELKRVQEKETGLVDLDVPILIADCVASDLEHVVDSIESLAEAGCDLIWLDYIQKIRGHNDQRNNEVATSFTRCQSAAKKGGASLMVASQVTGVPPGQFPKPYHARETRDLSNEARVILSGCRVDPDDPHLIQYMIEKCTHGISGRPYFQMQRDSTGTLRPVSELEGTSNDSTMY